jgi:hypothetical protein
MIVATYRTDVPLAGTSIEYEDGRLFVGETPPRPLTAGELLALDAAGEIEWAYEGLREWAQGSVAPRLKGRSPRIAVAGFTLALVGLLGLFSIGLVMHTDFEMTVWWPVVFPASLVVGLAGCALSAVGYIWARRKGLRRDLALAGVFIGIAPAASAAGPVLFFFVVTAIWGA